MPANPTNVDEYLEIGCGRCEFGGTPDCKVNPWTVQLRSLREILVESGLREEVKWSAPCYTSDGKNVLTLSALKACVVVSFFRGSEMRDPAGILEKPGANSRFARYARFQDVETIRDLRETLLTYIEEAVALERSGVKAVASDDGALESPLELTQAFDADPDFAKAFAALTPGRQRGYLIHFSGAKQSKTRAARIEKFKSKIFLGKGWNDR